MSERSPWICPQCSIAVPCEFEGPHHCPRYDHHVNARYKAMRQRKARRYHQTEDQAVEAAQMGGDASEADDYRALGSYAYSAYCQDLKKQGRKPPW